MFHVNFKICVQQGTLREVQEIAYFPFGDLDKRKPTLTQELAINI